MIISSTPSSRSLLGERCEGLTGSCDISFLKPNLKRSYHMARLRREINVMHQTLKRSNKMESKSTKC